MPQMKVEIYLTSEWNEEDVTEWFRELAYRTIVNPFTPNTAVEIFTREHHPVAETQRLADLNPALVRPARGTETYRVQIPGLPEDMSMPVNEPNVDQALLAKILAENDLNRRIARGIVQAKTKQTIDLGSFAGYADHRE